MLYLTVFNVYSVNIIAVYYFLGAKESLTLKLEKDF